MAEYAAMENNPGLLLMLVPFAIWLGVVAFVVVMALRLVRGIERIATALEQRR